MKTRNNALLTTVTISALFFGSSPLYAEIDRNLMPEVTHSSDKLETQATPKNSEFPEESKLTFEDKVKKVQIKLMVIGYDIPSVDGELKKETRLAIIEFQKDKKLNPTGYPNQRTLNALNI